MSSSPPRPRRTSEKAVAPSSTAKMKAVVRVVSCRTLVITPLPSRRLIHASSKAPAAPTPAASVGVASPKKMLPSTARIRKAGGRIALTSPHTAVMSMGSCSVAGAASGRIRP